MSNVHDQSEIHDLSENADVNNDEEDNIVSGILSRFYPKTDDKDNLDVQNSPKETDSNNDKNSDIAIHQLPQPTFKMPLSIEIMNEESEEEDHMSEQDSQDYEHQVPVSRTNAHRPNNSPWTKDAIEKKLSPFVDYK